MTQTDLLNLTEQEEDALQGKYLIFAMDNELYGMEIRYITEIIGIQPITAVPGMLDFKLLIDCPKLLADDELGMLSFTA